MRDKMMCAGKTGVERGSGDSRGRERRREGVREGEARGLFLPLFLASATISLYCCRWRCASSSDLAGRFLFRKWPHIMYVYTTTATTTTNVTQEVLQHGRMAHRNTGVQRENDNTALKRVK